MRSPRSSGAALPLALALVATFAPRAAPFAQDRFAISFWVDPVVNASNYAIEYARIARANFTALMGGFGATDPATVDLQIAACAAAGLACIPSACETKDGPGPSGSCVGAAGAWGFQMEDEPQRSEFPALAAWAATVATRAPGALRFINLLPNYYLPAPSSPVYDAYVADFVSIVKPDILCFDHYPQFYPGSESTTTDDVSMAGYHRNLRIVRAAAKGASIPFWNFFNSMPYGTRADVSEAQLRWQVFTSLAYGSSGVLYFCYWSPEAGDTFQWGNAIMSPRALPGGAGPQEEEDMEEAQLDASSAFLGAASSAHAAVRRPALGGAAAYVEGPKFAMAQRINSKLRVYGSYLLRANSTFVFQANGTGVSLANITSTGGEAPAISAIGGSGAGATWSVLLGAFASVSGGSQAFAVQNQDYILPAVYSISFSGGFPLELDASTGALAPAYDDAPQMAGFQLYVDAGDARVLVF